MASVTQAGDFLARDSSRDEMPKVLRDEVRSNYFKNGAQKLSHIENLAVLIVENLILYDKYQVVGTYLLSGI